MRIFLITLTLLVTLISPASAATQLPKVDTVKQALWVLNHEFPDWNDNYKEGEFDCSEMSAFVRDYLNYCGLDAKIQSGRGEDVWGYPGWSNHAWVICQGQNIECTELKIEPDSLYAGFRRYTLPPSAFPERFDWWNSEYLKSRGFEQWPVPNK